MDSDRFLVCAIALNRPTNRSMNRVYTNAKHKLYTIISAVLHVYGTAKHCVNNFVVASRLFMLDTRVFATITEIVLHTTEIGCHLSFFAHSHSSEKMEI